MYWACVMFPDKYNSNNDCSFITDGGVILKVI